MEQERESGVQRDTCQALWLLRGNGHPDHCFSLLPLAVLPGSPTGHRQGTGARRLLVQSMGPEQRRQSICRALGE